ncbi:MAG TPA: prolyl oligopeptidase family serine peptidase, partial [Fimbriimonadaceae bacterium]|nr:prolyl oligopeptidase family serine peptidase [Fimbriimonadaceae bacterium]
PNPKVALFIVDMNTKSRIQVDAEFGDPSLGHYVFEVRWSPSGDELLFHRTNRKQNFMEFCAANPSTGKSRVIIREEWLPSWTENSPPIQWFEDKKRFLWTSERNGFRNLYLGNIDGSPLKPITSHQFDVGNVVRLDEKGGRLWYMARSADNPYRMQLHRVGVDGKNDKRLTDPKHHHSVNLSPTGSAFVDTVESIETAPTVRLCNAEGKVLATVSESDLTKFKELGLNFVERFKFKAADGVTDCYGTLQKPSDFDPLKKYPLIVDVYGGPDSGGSPDRFALPDARTELGFLIVWIDGRGTSGRGKAFKDPVYGKLGVVEIDDQAAGVKALAARPYVDATRVGINGTSYGGYSSVMAVLRHPDVFHVGVACSSVTAWENYDTIYTERYMGLPWENENKAGYEAASAMTYAKNLKGNLMLFYGTADNNVHPANTYQLVRALQRAGKRFDLMVGPDQGHAGINGNLELEYFIENLILRSGRPSPPERGKSL